MCKLSEKITQIKISGEKHTQDVQGIHFYSSALMIVSVKNVAGKKNIYQVNFSKIRGVVIMRVR